MQALFWALLRQLLLADKHLLSTVCTLLFSGCGSCGVSESSLEGPLSMTIFSTMLNRMALSDLVCVVRCTSLCLPTSAHFLLFSVFPHKWVLLGRWAWSVRGPSYECPISMSNIQYMGNTGLTSNLSYLPRSTSVCLPTSAHFLPLFRS